VRAYDGAARDLSTRPVDFAPDKLEQAWPRLHVKVMSGKDKQRDERLAAALRENLRRRKAQSRELDADKKTETRET
jgi:uncharacterized protein YajQ (UPF0234 family)